MKTASFLLLPLLPCIAAFAPKSFAPAAKVGSLDSRGGRCGSALSALDPGILQDLSTSASSSALLLSDTGSAVVPDLFINLGPRALLSLTGIITLVAGVWYTDRKWDEEGSKAYERAKASLKQGDDAVSIPQEELDAAFAFPLAFLVGWALFGLSYLFPASGEWALDITAAGLAAAAFSALLAFVASVPMEEAVKNRDGDSKTKLSAAFAAGWVGLTASTIAGNGLGAASSILNPIGMVSILFSMKLLWQYRKMGDSWEQEGKPNEDAVVYNMGGPLFVLGWFLYWIGMASTSDLTQWGTMAALPIYFNARTALAFIAGAGMVPIVMALDYSHDEGGEYVGFGTDGKRFGRFLESPIPFILAWTAFGTANLLTYDGDAIGLRNWIILALCVAQGIDAGVLIQESLYKGDMEGKNKFSIPFVLMFAALAASIGDYQFSQNLALALPGAFMIVLGQKTVFGDRKRGDYWMETNKVNPNPVVYSAGEPLFMTGWLLIAWAISLPFIPA